MKSKILASLPILICIVVLVFLWVNFEHLVKEDSNEPSSGAEKKYQDVIHHFESFDKASEVYFVPNKETKFEGDQSAYVAKDNVFGVTYVSDSARLLRMSDLMEVSFMIYAKHPVKGMKFGFSIGDDKENLIFVATPIEPIKDSLIWVKRELSIPVDKRLLKKDIKLQLRSYILNETKEEFFVDNFDIKIKTVQP